MALPSPEALIRLGWAATAGSVVMYFAYVDQILRNLHGEKGSLIQPAAATACCTLWLLYGALREKRDWPIIMANIPGIVLGAATVLTAL
ncbi:SemiSWEET family transporter [Sphingomonas sp. CJ20]